VRRLEQTAVGQPPQPPRAPASPKGQRPILGG
jgi:hypothetical protein